jgi:dUTP pyrophosphatase
MTEMMNEPVAAFKLADPDRPVRLPERSTSGSAGYDFFAPKGVTIGVGDKVIFDTGVKVNIQPGWALILIPRSSRGSEGLVITNTVGLIDSDFKGEIRAFLKNDNSYHSLRINEGEKYMQGVFIPYGIAANDEASAERTGGVGSTGY